jgi:hypothetical protein
MKQQERRRNVGWVHGERHVLLETMRARPAIAVTLLAPILAAAVVAVTAPHLSVLVAVASAIALATPATILASGAAAWATERQGRQRHVAVDTTRSQLTAQLNDRHDLRLRDNKSLLYADWYFRLRIEDEIQRAKRYGLKLALLVFSPDEEKAPSAAPDPIGFAQALRSELRGSDLPGTLSEQQIAVLLPNTGVRRAQKVVARLESLALRFGYTIGSASLVSEAMEREELIQAALGSAQQRSDLKMAA